MLALRDIAVAALVLIVAMGGIAAYEGRVPRPAVVSAKPAPKPAKPVVLVKTLVAAPPTVALLPRTVALAVAKHPLPADAVAEAPLPPQAIEPDPATLADEAKTVAARLSAKVPAALAPYFDTYIYVSKADGGPLGQRLFLFRKNDDGTLAFEQSFPVSTGRERSEQYFTATPTGLFELDVHRFMPMARSAKWNDAAMPWAMFLNYSYRTQMSGVALHAAIGRHELAMMGRRASGGCVRLPLPKADELFHRFLAGERGEVPVFAFDEARGTTNTDGRIAHDARGDAMLSDGIKVLVVIENYAGESAVSPQS